MASMWCRSTTAPRTAWRIKHALALSEDRADVLLHEGWISRLLVCKAAGRASDTVNCRPRDPRFNRGLRPPGTTPCSPTFSDALLLMVPTLLGVVTLTFVVTQFVPGGPVEQVMTQLRHGAGRGGEAGSGGGGYHGSQGVDPQQFEQTQEAVRLRQAAARALRPDAQALRDLRPRPVATISITACGT